MSVAPGSAPATGPGCRLAPPGPSRRHLCGTAAGPAVGRSRFPHSPWRSTAPTRRSPRHRSVHRCRGSPRRQRKRRRPGDIPVTSRTIQSTIQSTIRSKCFQVKQLIHIASLDKNLRIYRQRSQLDSQIAAKGPRLSWSCVAKT